MANTDPDWFEFRFTQNTDLGTQQIVIYEISDQNAFAYIRVSTFVGGGGAANSYSMILKVPIGLKKPAGSPQISLIKVDYVIPHEVYNGGSILIQDKIFVISSYTSKNS